MKPKNIFFPNLFSEIQCKEIYTEFNNLLNSGYLECNRDEDTFYYYNSVGKVNLDITLNYISYLTEIIRNSYQQEIEFKNSYIRLYKPNSHLLIHTDRHGLDITLSINIWGLENWALHISNVFYKTWRADYGWDPFCDKEQYKKDYASFVTPKGSGISCYGRNFPHWRDKLVCKDDEFMVQLFYHWSIV